MKTWTTTTVSDLYRGDIVEFVQNDRTFYGAVKFVETGRFGKVVGVESLQVELDPNKEVEVYR